MGDEQMGTTGDRGLERILNWIASDHAPGAYDWHPSPEQLDEWERGCASPELARAVDEHLLRCDGCQEMLEAEKGQPTREDWTKLPAPKAPPEVWLEVAEAHVVLSPVPDGWLAECPELDATTEAPSVDGAIAALVEAVREHCLEVLEHDGPVAGRAADYAAFLSRHGRRNWVDRFERAVADRAADIAEKAAAIQQELDAPVIDIRAALDAVASWFTVQQQKPALKAAGDAGERTSMSREFPLLQEDKVARGDLGDPTVRVRVDPDSRTIRSATVRILPKAGVDRMFSFVTPEGVEIAGERSEDGDEWNFDISRAPSPVGRTELSQCSIRCRQFKRE